METGSYRLSTELVGDAGSVMRTAPTQDRARSSMFVALQSLAAVHAGLEMSVFKSQDLGVTQRAPERESIWEGPGAFSPALKSGPWHIGIPGPQLVTTDHLGAVTGVWYRKTRTFHNYNLLLQM